ncbi:MAG: hypothetical protein ACUVXD_07580 [Thermodesulfobacteriota bacterium]
MDRSGVPFSRLGSIRALGILAMVVAFDLAQSPQAWGGQTQLTVLHTSSVAGYLFGCET